MQALEPSGTDAGGTTRPWHHPRTVALVVLGATSVVVFFVIQPHLLFVANTPSGGDMGAHVLVPAYLRDNLLPDGRLAGWSNDWFAGFPILYFYFPLPALSIVALDLVVPYGVAFKIVSVLGLLAMPYAGYYFGRGMGFARPVATVIGAATAGFMLMESFSIYGGNIKSTFAGEYSYSWSFVFALLYLGTLLQDTREGRRFSPRAGIFLALMALSHVLTTLVVATFSLLLVLRARALVRTVASWLLGFALAAFWAVPLLATIGFSADMNWQPLRGADDVLPTELWPLLLVAAAGAVVALWRRYDVGLALLITLVPLVAYPFLEGKLWNGRILPFWFYGVFLFAGIAVGLGAMEVWKRLPQASWSLPAATTAGALVMLVPAFVGMNDPVFWAAWNFAGYEGYVGPVASTGRILWLALQVVAIVLLAGYIAWRYPRRRRLAGFVGVVGVVVAIVTGLGGVHQKPFDEYENLMATVDELPPGRIMWEANNEMNRYGTPLALMLFPYWSDGHPSMEGLLYESSLSTPFHFLNAAEVSQKPSNPIPGLPYRSFDLDRALAHLAVFDVRYYVTFTEEAAAAARAHSAYTEVAAADPWVIFELPPSDLVEVARYQPAVYEEPDPPGPVERLQRVLSDPEPCIGVSDGSCTPSFFDVAVGWYGDVNRLDRWLAEEGPADWPRVDADLAALDLARPLPAEGVVSDVVLEDHRIAFRTTAVGQPHLVKVSFFPNWRAEGADGPYRAAPAFMLVVPTQEEVELRFEDRWPESVGKLLSAAGIVALGGWWWWRRRQLA